MGFSSIAVEQREKEAESLKPFLAFSLIASLALHIWLLTLGIGNLLNRAPELEEEPIEVTLIEPPTVEAAKPQQETQKETQEETQSSGGSGAAGGSGSAGGIEVAKAPTRVNAPPPPPIIAEKLPTPIPTTPIEKPVNNLKPEPVREPKPVPTPEAMWTPKPVPTPKVAATPKPAQQPKPVPSPEAMWTPKPAWTPPPKIAAEPKPVIRPSPPIPSISPEPAPTSQRVPVAVNQSPRATKPATPNSLPPQIRSQDTAKLREAIAASRNSRENPGTAENSNGPRQTTVTGTGNKPGSGSTVATGPGTAREGTRPGEGEGDGDPTGSGSGRLACRKCSEPKYPQSARRQGLEGTTRLSVDVDSKGNVIDVRLASSSGHSELDEAAIKQVKRWKFDAPAGGRQGVPVRIEFNMEGSG